MSEQQLQGLTFKVHLFFKVHLSGFKAISLPASLGLFLSLSLSLSLSLFLSLSLSPFLSLPPPAYCGRGTVQGQAPLPRLPLAPGTAAPSLPSPQRPREGTGVHALPAALVARATKGAGWPPLPPGLSGLSLSLSLSLLGRPPHYPGLSLFQAGHLSSADGQGTAAPLRRRAAVLNRCCGSRRCAEQSSRRSSVSLCLSLSLYVSLSLSLSLSLS